ncbi:DUF2563 family protein [Mycolicibacterium sp. J2]|uniref:DUF2563 family protein n=1 Tax=Mycolicibacterium sp. J2 TaxID=2993511 RepID=UPI00224B770A|nr:DUF2563 family protein [Mycolicibacterium sp. J2]MCX2710693.1 DUF2563 family protein [Mycolicibacterium sp. J2]
MTGHGMEVDTAHLEAGADRCSDAAATAATAAGRLADRKPQPGIFGDFAEAHAFLQSLSQAHQGHVETLQTHHRVVSGIGEKGRSGAQLFTAHDASSADAIQNAAAGFDGI